MEVVMNSKSLMLVATVGVLGATVVGCARDDAPAPAGAASAAPQNEAATTQTNTTTAVEDAMIHGKLEATYALNRHLSAFAIDTDVDNGVVTLSGTVPTDIDRDLATEIARGVEGVKAVNSERLVSAANARDTSEKGQRRQAFAAWVDDTTTAAAVKSKLIGNDNIRARDIDVDSEDDVVTLRGHVESDEQSQLAEQLARNTEEVRDVRNELVIASR
jgi:osmotically-inducible protein OsmY